MKKGFTFLFILILFLIAFLLTGCEGFTPSIPDDEYDQENTVVDHIKVYPANVEMTVNQSKKFEVKAYNSENKLIAMDVSKVKWSCLYQCFGCGIVWKLSPTQNSLQTNFVPERTGYYGVWANYEGKWAHADIQVNE